MEDPEKKNLKIGEVGHLFLSGQKGPPGERRETILEEALRAPPQVASVIAICSARADVSRSIFSVNLAMELSRINCHTAILPQLSIAPNALTLLGLDGLQASGDPKGIQTLTGPFGIQLLLLDDGPSIPIRHLKSRTLTALDEISRKTSFILTEIPDSVTKKDISLLKLADEAILLVPPDPEMMTGAFKQLKILADLVSDLSVWIVACEVDSAADGEKIYREMEDLSEEFLGKRLEYLGFVYKDPRYFLTCIEDPSAILRGRFSRVRKCMFDIGKFLCMMDDLNKKTTGQRPPLPKRL